MRITGGQVFDLEQGFLARELCTDGSLISIASGEVQILQQAQLFCVGIREVTVIPLFQKIPEQQLVQFVNARLCGQFIGMELAGILKKTAQFLF